MADQFVTIDSDSGILPAPVEQRVGSRVLASGPSVFADLIARADTGVSDVRWLIISDSTAAATDGWVDQLIPMLAARFPHLTISYRKWVDGTPGSYGTAAVTPGTGPQTLHIFNGSKAGETWQYHFEATRLPVLISATNPDAIMVSLGHNDNPAALASGTKEPQRGKAIGYIETLRTIAPAAQIVLSSQNPLLTYPKASENRADMLRSLARSRGFGFVDVCKAFHDDGRAVAGTLTAGDDIHPTTAGYAVWAARVAQEFPLDPSGKVQAQAQPAFSSAGMNMFPDAAFATYTGAAVPDGWTLARLDHARTTVAGEFESTGGALKLTKNTTGQIAYAERPLPLPLVKGRTIVCAVRMFIPAGSAGNKVQAVLRDNAATQASEAFTAPPGQWHWRIVAFRVADTATGAWLRLMVDATTGAANEIVVDRIGVWVGDYPFDPGYVA